jgi:hypothetical protein
VSIRTVAGPVGRGATDHSGGPCALLAFGVVATVVNALPSADLNATLVDWRLKHALPRHRAVSLYARKDTRVVMPRLLKMLNGDLPSDPASAHKVFLLLRGCFFLIVFGP